MVETLLREIKTDGLAVVGPEACRAALQQRQVDVLVLAKEMLDFTVKEELVKMAEWNECQVEIVNGSDARKILMKFLEQFFEHVLWNSRLIMLIVVLASIVVALAILYITTVDVLYMFSNLIQYADPALGSEARNEMRLDTIGQVIGMVDSYLIAAVMLIFGQGIYELFVNKIDTAEGSEVGKRLLVVRSLDDLKDKLAKVVILILIVKFTQQALQLKYQTVQDLFYLAVGILLMGGAIYFTQQKGEKKIGKES